MLDRVVSADGLMSIETLLTLGLTAVILVVAFVLRVVILSVVKVGLLLAGKDTPRLQPHSAAVARPPLRTRLASAGRRTAAGWAHVGAGLTSAGRKTAAGLAFLRPHLASAGRKTAAALALLAALLAAGVASVGRAGVAGAAGLERWADATNQRLAPHTMEATAALRRSAAAGGRRIAPVLVTTVATVQHVASLTLVRARPRGKHSIPPESAADEPRRVIDLDRDRDDEPIVPRTERPAAGVRL